MATATIIAVGKMSLGSTVLRVAPVADLRTAELLAWQEETGSPLPLPADLILWLEDRGYATDLVTGEVFQLEPLQDAIDYAAELQELVDDCADREYWASGNW